MFPSKSTTKRFCLMPSTSIVRQSPLPFAFSLASLQKSLNFHLRIRRLGKKTTVAMDFHSIPKGIKQHPEANVSKPSNPQNQTTLKDRVSDFAPSCEPEQSANHLGAKHKRVSCSEGLDVSFGVGTPLRLLKGQSQVPVPTIKPEDWTHPARLSLKTPRLISGPGDSRRTSKKRRTT